MKVKSVFVILLLAIAVGSMAQKDIQFTYKDCTIRAEYFVKNLNHNAQRYVNSKNWSSEYANLFYKSLSLFVEGIKEGRLRYEADGSVYDSKGLIKGDYNSCWVDQNWNILSDDEYNSLSKKKKEKIRRAYPNNDVVTFIGSVADAIIEGAKKGRKKEQELKAQELYIPEKEKQELAGYEYIGEVDCLFASERNQTFTSGYKWKVYLFGKAMGNTCIFKVCVNGEKKDPQKCVYMLTKNADKSIYKYVSEFNSYTKDVTEHLRSFDISHYQYRTRVYDNGGYGILIYLNPPF